MKRILLTLLCLPLLALSQCVLGDCENGYGVSKEENGDVFSGEWLNGKKNGYGYLEINSGGYYIGEFRNNNFEGFGYFVLPDGNLYFGELKDSQKSGYGYFEYPDEVGIYRGVFKLDDRHGIGVYADKTSDKTKYYMGSFLNDEPKMKPKKKVISGCLAGKCSKGREGVFVGDNIVIGKWEKKKISGIGLLESGNDMCIGEFKDGTVDGLALYFWGSTQELYLGSFIAGNTNFGHTLLKRNDGEVYIGESSSSYVNNGKGVSVVQQKNKPNEYFIGTWKNGKVVEVESYILK